MTNRKLDYKRIENIGFLLSKNVFQNKKNLKNLCNDHSKNSNCLRLFGSYLKNILNDSRVGKQLLIKSMYEEQKSIKNRKVNYEKFTYFDELNGIMLVSANEYNLGDILYLNQTAADILNIEYTKD